jgi:hypothetical protein
MTLRLTVACHRTTKTVVSPVTISQTGRNDRGAAEWEIAGSKRGRATIPQAREKGGFHAWLWLLGGVWTAGW